MDKILIITSIDDSHADFLIDKCNKLGKSEYIVRLNTESFINNCEASFYGHDFIIRIKDSEREIKGSEIKAVWYRRPMPLNISYNNINDQGVLDFISQQSKAFLQGLYFCSNEEATWVNPLPSMQKAKMKLPQLKLANELGFNVPKSLVTNNKADVMSFIKEVMPVCNKSLDKPSYYIDGQFYPFLTKKFEDITEISSQLESITTCPVFFQEYIEKIYDIRVVIIDEEIFSFEIHSQNDILSTVDFRGKSPHLMEHKTHKLPINIENKIREFMRKQQLVFSSMDLILAQDGEYYFIENNCNGQWLWLEILTEVNMSQYMINLLFSKVRL